jgi:hypothetical protein
MRVKCQKRPPAKFFVKKDHVLVAARLGRRLVSPVAWAKSGMYMPPSPTSAGLLTGNAVDRHYLWWSLPPGPMPAWEQRRMSFRVLQPPCIKMDIYTDGYKPSITYMTRELSGLEKELIYARGLK